tara:strand:+ start:292 stop:1335 length:1044 start_codon:yes stop_codon:yes gene_type:complete
VKIRKLNGFLYQTTFRCESDDLLKLLELEKFYRKKNIQSKIMTSEFSPATNLWTKWIDNYFFSVSANSISFLGGFSNGYSQSQRFLNTSKNIKFRVNQFFYHFKSLVRTISGLRNDDDLVNKSYLKKQFKKIYPEKFSKDFQNLLFNQIFQSNPLIFLTHLEYFIQNKFHKSNDKKVLEIGSGSCISPALMKYFNKDNKFVLVDLKETMMIGYCFLKFFFPELKILLPQDFSGDLNFKKFDVLFIFPNQLKLLKNGSFDLATNCSSFQEMDIQVVNAYLNQIDRVLKQDGIFSSSNCSPSRYFSDNRYENYKLKNFDIISKKKLKFVETIAIMPKPYRNSLLVCKKK